MRYVTFRRYCYCPAYGIRRPFYKQVRNQERYFDKTVCDNVCTGLAIEDVFLRLLPLFLAVAAIVDCMRADIGGTVLINPVLGNTNIKICFIGNEEYNNIRTPVVHI